MSTEAVSGSATAGASAGTVAAGSSCAQEPAFRIAKPPVRPVSDVDEGRFRTAKSDSAQSADTFRNAKQDSAQSPGAFRIAKPASAPSADAFRIAKSDPVENTEPGNAGGSAALAVAPELRAADSAAASVPGADSAGATAAPDLVILDYAELGRRRRQIVGRGDLAEWEWDQMLLRSYLAQPLPLKEAAVRMCPKERAGDDAPPESDAEPGEAYSASWLSRRLSAAREWPQPPLTSAEWAAYHDRLNGHKPKSPAAGPPPLEVRIENAAQQLARGVRKLVGLGCRARDALRIAHRAVREALLAPDGEQTTKRSRRSRRAGGGAPGEGVLTDKGDYPAPNGDDPCAIGCA